jgi:hypothetical protein
MVFRADPRVWKVAREVADADATRLEVMADGSVFIDTVRSDDPRRPATLWRT